jgi:hypothetical protein
MEHDERNDRMGVVTVADHVDGATCTLCHRPVVDGDRIYLSLDTDRSIHYSHVGERVSYAVWLGYFRRFDAVIRDDGENFGFDNGDPDMGWATPEAVDSVELHNPHCTCRLCYAAAMTAEMKARGNPDVVPADLL